MEFEWDPRKDAANQRKHGVGFREATTVFGDPLATTFMDTAHLTSEQRYLTIGSSANGSLLVVAHTERGNAIRIISARPLTPREKKFYEEEH
ncbi:MAG: BrnT family toxin [Candidatus Sulfotelmatobacter sp.]